MNFISFEYLFFLFCLFFIVYFLPKGKRWYILLIASFLFCGFYDLIILGILSTSIILNYTFGIIIEKFKSKRFYFYLFILTNIIFLVVVKYYVSENLLISLGVSFYTLQNISYLIDIKNGKIAAEKNILIYALFISFFPKFLLGPIEKANSFLTVLKTKTSISDANISNGCRLLLWGFFKKIVIANYISENTDLFLLFTTYKNFATDMGSIACMLSIIFLAIQLYVDLSSYVDIARGSALLLGYNLTKNFNNPFVAISVGDFWRRWHISVSNWFKEYIYYPVYLHLQRNNYFKNIKSDLKYKLYYIVSISSTFILLGLWHKINLNFLFVGIIQSTALSIETLFINPKKSLNIVSKIFIRIYPIVVFLITMIFFYTNNLSDAFKVIKTIMSFNTTKTFLEDGEGIKFVIIIFFIIFMFVTEYLHSKGKLDFFLKPKYVYFRWLTYLVLIFITLYFGNFLQKETFIYESF